MSSVRPVGGLGGGFGPLRTENRRPADKARAFEDGLDVLTRPREAPPPPTPAQSAPKPITFSKHAQARMESRNIALGDADIQDLSKTMDELARRVAKESLVLMGDNAFIVGIPDRKIITVMTRHEAAGNFFTQIDSTAVVR